MENEVRQEYVNEVLGALGAKDMSSYAGDSEIGILVSKNSLESVIGNEIGEEDLDLGNEILYLRDRGVLEVAPMEDDTAVGVKHSSLERPDRVVWKNREFSYPEEEPGWLGGPEGEPLEDLSIEDVMEVEYVIADALKQGEKRISPGYIQRFIDGSRDPWKELTLLAATGRGEIDMEDGQLYYIPNPEYIDEMEALASYRTRNHQGPVHEFRREIEPEDLQLMYEEGVELVDEMMQAQ